MLKKRFGCDHEIMRNKQTYSSNFELNGEKINLVVLPPWNKLDIKTDDQKNWRTDEECTLKILPIYYDDQETFEEMKVRIAKWINNETQAQVDAGEVLHSEVNVNVEVGDLRFWKPDQG